MTAVSCPSCEELVRIPSLDLPRGSSIECPWCKRCRPSDIWLNQLPPLANVFSSDGTLLFEGTLAPTASNHLPTPRPSASRASIQMQGLGENTHKPSEAEQDDFELFEIEPIDAESIDFEPVEINPDTVEQQEPASDAYESEPAAVAQDSDADSSLVDIYDQAVRPEDSANLAASHEPADQSLLAEATSNDLRERKLDPARVAGRDPVEFTLDPHTEDPELVSQAADSPSERVIAASDAKTVSINQSWDTPPRSWGRPNYEVRRRVLLAASILFTTALLGYVAYTAHEFGHFSFLGGERTSIASQSLQHAVRVEPTHEAIAATDKDERLIQRSESNEATSDRNDQDPLARESARHAKPHLPPYSDTELPPDSNSNVTPASSVAQRKDNDEPRAKAFDFEQVLDNMRDNPVVRTERYEPPKPKLTAAMRARQNLEKKRARSGSKLVSDHNDEAEAIRRSLLVFPDEPPSIDEVQTANQTPTSTPVRIARVLQPSTPSRDSDAPDQRDTEALAVEVLPPIASVPSAIASNPADKTTTQVFSRTSESEAHESSRLAQQSAPPPASPSATTVESGESSVPRHSPPPKTLDDRNTNDAASTSTIVHTQRENEAASRALPESHDQPHEVSETDDFPTDPQDAASRQLVEACDRAIRSIDKLSNTEARDRSSRAFLIDRLRAFQNIARVASMPMDSDVASVERLLAAVSRPDVLRQLDSLGSDWIGWSNRDSDGILLVGTIEQIGHRNMLRVAGGLPYDVEVSEQLELPAESKCVVLGRIDPTEQSPRIQLIAGAVVP